MKHSEVLDTPQLDEHRTWKRLGQKEIERFASKDASNVQPRPSHLELWFQRTGQAIKRLGAAIFLQLVHKSARLTNKPLVDIGREYSVTALNDRIVQLEEILVRQWTNMKESDLLAPTEEVKQYVAACHVVRQYERISPELMATRLDISQGKAHALLQQMVEDEIITESYTVTFHDVRRSMADAAIERSLQSLKKHHPEEVTSGPADSKKH